MKPPLQLIYPLLILSASTASVRHLLREVGYLRFSEENGVPVWDLSQSSPLDSSPVSFRTYGDSLYSETIDGWRRWFRLTADSALIIQEETLSELMEYAVPIPTAATGHTGMACEHPYMTRGSDHSHIDIVQHGTYLSRLPVRGRLVISTGDTVGTVMTEEEIRYDRIMRTAQSENGSFNPSGEEALKERHRVAMRRWFTSGPLPAALSIIYEVEDEEGNGGYTIENTYIADFGHTEMTEEDIVNRPDEDTAAILGDMTVTVSGGLICLSIPTSGQMLVTIDLLSDSGIPYLHAEREVAGTEPVILPCGSLPPGRHLIAVSASGHTERRVFSLR